MSDIEKIKDLVSSNKFAELKLLLHFFLCIFLRKIYNQTFHAKIYKEV